MHPAATAAAAQEPTWYAVLGVAPDASADAVKRAFRQAALRLHPDKAQAQPTAAASDGDASSGTHGHRSAAGADRYRLVQQAWEVLGDAERRAAYDRQLVLAAVAADVHINETVLLEELLPEMADGQPCLAWPCRCGGSYLLLAEDAEAASAAALGGEAAELAVPCSTCSLHIRVQAAPPAAQRGA